MINTEDFIERLKKVIDYYGESASSFAEKIGVQRSSISHILSGRNKPSLDFILKILNTYPEVELYWLLNGKGHFPNQPDLFQKVVSPQTTTENLKINPVEPKQSQSSKTIKRIVIFYDDGTFENFEKQ